MRRSLALGILMALAAVGCECAGSSETGSGEGDHARASTGTIVGVVRLVGSTEVPQYPESPVQVEGRPPLPPECTPPRLVDRTPVTIAEESGGLAGLSIVVTGDEASWPVPGEPQTHEVAIRDCRLTPSLLIATRGDRLRLTNETEYPFFPDVGDGMLQFRTEPREVPLDQGGVRTIQCGFAAPCGRLELITLYHPIHGVSQPDGRFRIENVPADQEVRVTAWHPLFREAFTTTTVAAGQTVEVELTIEADQIRIPEPPPGPGPDGPAELDPDPNVPF